MLTRRHGIDCTVPQAAPPRWRAPRRAPTARRLPTQRHQVRMGRGRGRGRAAARRAASALLPMHPGGALAGRRRGRSLAPSAGRHRCDRIFRLRARDSLFPLIPACHAY
eukprot:365062-Chlamydomonas_euryale.AAC.8